MDIEISSRFAQIDLQCPKTVPLSPMAMSLPTAATWDSLPEETKFKILGHLLGHTHRVEGRWQYLVEWNDLNLRNRFVYDTTLSPTPLLVNREFLRLGQDALRLQVHITLDLCRSQIPPLPSNIFSSAPNSQSLGAILPGIRSLVLPNFASLDIGTFRKNLPNLNTIKVNDTAPVYMEGNYPMWYTGNSCNDLHKVDAVKLAEITENDHHLLKLKVDSWLYSPRQACGNVCGSVDKFSHSDLNDIDLYFTAEVGIDISELEKRTRKAN